MKRCLIPLCDKIVPDDYEYCPHCAGSIFEPLIDEKEPVAEVPCSAGLSDVVVRMGIELIWEGQSVDIKEIARRQDIEVKMQRNIFKFRQRIRNEILGQDR